MTVGELRERLGDWADDVPVLIVLERNQTDVGIEIDEVDDRYDLEGFDHCLGITLVEG